MGDVDKFGTSHRTCASNKVLYSDNNPALFQKIYFSYFFGLCTGTILAKNAIFFAVFEVELLQFFVTSCQNTQIFVNSSQAHINIWDIVQIKGIFLAQLPYEKTRLKKTCIFRVLPITLRRFSRFHSVISQKLDERSLLNFAHMEY